ncbi:MAG: methionine--tRNA ligase, partial [Candidatus Aenigmarchaeota archaeon]|nr:methionine--tRNA ligase [Candidatus Aenigmarchaeota archaeon]
LFGTQNIYICGTDEHGTPTEIAALNEKTKPQQYADKYHKIQKDIYEKWNFDFTFFGRTSSKNHYKLVQKFFLAMNRNGYITKDDLTLPFCTNNKMWLADRFINGTCPHCSYENARGDQCENCGRLLDPVDLKKPRCAICGQSAIKFRKRMHLFLDLPKLQPELERWISKQNNWPQNTLSLAKGWLKEGLKKRCITRETSWGVPVPLHGFKNLVFYVWFDAPIGYISMTEEAASNAKNRKRIGKWQRWWTEGQIYHFLGKDNIPFHTIMWPAMLMAASKDSKNKGTKFSLPSYVAGYEYLNWEGQKFSTSRSIGIFSDKALELFPADYWRYYLSSILPETKDSNFEWQQFQSTINNELIANYGNAFYRITSFISQHFGKVPAKGDPGRPEEEMQSMVADTSKRVEKLVAKVRLREALKETMELSSYVNSYFQVKEPWFAIRSPRTKKDAKTCLHYSVNAIASVTTMLYPFIPSTASAALNCLGIRKAAWDNVKKFPIKSGAKVRPLILFQRIEDDELEKAKKASAER